MTVIPRIHPLNGIGVIVFALITWFAGCNPAMAGWEDLLDDRSRRRGAILAMAYEGGDPEVLAPLWDDERVVCPVVAKLGGTEILLSKIAERDTCAMSWLSTVPLETGLNLGLERLSDPIEDMRNAAAGWVRSRGTPPQRCVACTARTVSRALPPRRSWASPATRALFRSCARC